MEHNCSDKPGPRQINTLFTGAGLILRETKREVTAFGGVSVFVAYLRRIDLVGRLRQWMPVRWRSPNHIDPSATFVSFLIAVFGSACGRKESPARTGSETVLSFEGMQEKVFYRCASCHTGASTSE